MMDSDCDVFAGLTDFCENYTADKVKAADVEIESSESAISDCEEESIFLNGAKSLPKKGAKNNSPSKSKKGDDISNVIFDESTAARGTRSRRRRANISIGEYMAQQTRATLNVQNAKIVQNAAATQNQTHGTRNNTQRGRARRNYMIEKAANARVIGTVDLAGPPTPPLPQWSCRRTEIVSLSSDEDDLLVGVGNNSSFDLENAEIFVKVKWGDKIDVVPHRRHQKFVDLMKMFADRENVNINDVLLNLNDRIIDRDDTPDSIDYQIVQFISGRIIHNAENLAPTRRKEANSISIKIQSDAFKRPLEVSIKNDQPFKILYIKCSEELKKSCDQIKLSFDGEPLILNETPKDLDFEGGEVVDCRIIK